MHRSKQRLDSQQFLPQQFVPQPLLWHHAQAQPSTAQGAGLEKPDSFSVNLAASQATSSNSRSAAAQLSQSGKQQECSHTSFLQRWSASHTHHTYKGGLQRWSDSLEGSESAHTHHTHKGGGSGCCGAAAGCGAQAAFWAECIAGPRGAELGATDGAACLVKSPAAKQSSKHVYKGFSLSR